MPVDMLYKLMKIALAKYDGKRVLSKAAFFLLEPNRAGAARILRLIGTWQVKKSQTPASNGLSLR